MKRITQNQQKCRILIVVSLKKKLKMKVEGVVKYSLDRIEKNNKNHINSN